MIFNYESNGGVNFVMKKLKLTKIRDGNTMIFKYGFHISAKAVVITL